VNLKNPASDMATALDGETVGGVQLTTGQNLFYRMVHPMPMGLVVSLLNSGGDAPEPYFASTPSAFFRATVQALIYGMPGEDGFVDGEALARGLIEELHQQPLSGYVAVYARDSQPAFLGADPETQRWQWSVNFELQYTA
jgi:hypothetical protein